MALSAATIGATATILMSNGGPGPNAHGRRVRQMTPRDERQQRLQYPQDQQAQQPHSNFVAKGASEFQLPGLPPSRPTRKSVLRRLSEALMRRSLTMIDMSQRGLQPSDARLVKLALLQNSSLSILKLGYNNLCDDGATTLASGIAAHGALRSLDLGFNNLGDEGCTSLAKSLLLARATLHTLYLAGNSIGPAGATALADVVRQGCGLQRLHLTGNRIGPEGARAVVDAFVEDELRMDGHGATVMQNGDSPSPQVSSGPALDPRRSRGVKELFLGGTGMSREGCEAVARLLEHSSSLKVLSLANCDLGDNEAILLAESIKRNQSLPLETLQLSFNNLTCKGIEALMNAIWGSQTLRELRLDNNSISDRGAQVVSAVLSSVKTLTRLDLGFNSISSTGMKVLMKAVADNQQLSFLSISGNPIDTGAAKAVAYALAYNRSLMSLFLDHCSVGHEGQRHITAGIVSNSGTCLHTLTGFRIGVNAVSLGLPPALEQWANEQVLKFIHLMWERMRQDHDQYRMEKEIDPLHLLPSVPDGNPRMFSGPLDPATVVAVAKRAYESLGDNGGAMLSRRSDHPLEPSFESPVAEDAIMLEATESGDAPKEQHHFTLRGLLDPASMDVGESSYEPSDMNISVDDANGKSSPQSPPPAPNLSFDERRKWIVEWLCKHFQYLNELSQLPFSSAELWRLHQHFFTPSIQDMGGGNGSGNVSPTPNANSLDGFNNIDGSSIFSSQHPVSTSTQSSDGQICVPVSEPSLPRLGAPSRYMGTLPMLKRKVSYRFLNEAMLTSSSHSEVRSEDSKSVSKMIEDVSSQSMQPKFKKARRNKTRISFVPRIKAKLDSYLDACHQKALVLMRQLQFVEKALLNGHIYPLEAELYKHLSDTLAADAETILIDMT